MQVILPSIKWILFIPIIVHIFLLYRYDVGKDGFIDLMELKLMMEKLEAPQTHMGLKAMIKEVDEDLDNKINFREVCVSWCEYRMGKVAQTHMGLKAMIKELDEDLDNKINLREVLV